MLTEKTGSSADLANVLSRGLAQLDSGQKQALDLLHKILEVVMPVEDDEANRIADALQQLAACVAEQTEVLQRVEASLDRLCAPEEHRQG